MYQKKCLDAANAHLRIMQGTKEGRKFEMENGGKVTAGFCLALALTKTPLEWTAEVFADAQ